MKKTRRKVRRKSVVLYVKKASYKYLYFNEGKEEIYFDR